MNKLTLNIVIGAAIALMVAITSSYLTYIVVEHFNYIEELEKKVLECEGDKAELEQHNLGLLSQVSEPKSNLK